MVKKVSGPSGPSKANSVSSVSEMSEVKGISEISTVNKLSSVSGVGSLGEMSGLSGTKLTASNQKQVIEAIDSEAEKLFAGKRIPRKRQKTITDALKMAVIAATLKEEDEEE